MNNWYDYQALQKEHGIVDIKPHAGGYDIFVKGEWKRWYMALHKPGVVHIVNGEAWFGRDEPMTKTQLDWKRFYPESTWEEFRCHLLMLGYEPIKHVYEERVI